MKALTWRTMSAISKTLVHYSESCATEPKNYDEFTLCYRIGNCSVGIQKTQLFSGFLAPLAIGQQAYVMVRCPSCVRVSVR